MAAATPVDRLQRQGTDHLQNAMAFESAGDATSAVKEYQVGLEILFRCLRVAQSESKKQQLRTLIARYMDRAEALKPKLVDEKKSGVSVKANVPAEMRAAIEREIMDSDTKITFKDVAGLDDVKQALHEMVILPALRPDIFTGLFSPTKGLLLFGPPGNGKTFIAKAVANETKATFFSISASSLVSKYMGEGEKLVRALFAIAREKQPSIIFIDEIDSILSRRSSDENEASKRLKTEFLVQFNTFTADSSEDRVTVIGATNKPEDLDEAVIRRLPRRIYVGMPDAEARRALLKHTLKAHHCMTAAEFERLVDATQGYSGSDLKALCQDAAMGPLRDIGYDRLATVGKSAISRITLRHFEDAMTRIVPSVPPERLADYQRWNLEHNIAPQARPRTASAAAVGVGADAHAHAHAVADADADADADDVLAQAPAAPTSVRAPRERVQHGRVPVVISNANSQRSSGVCAQQ